MPRLDRMAQRLALDRLRQQVEKSREVVGLETFGRRELPVDRPELVAEFGDAAGDKAIDRFASFRQPAAMVASRGPLSAKTNPSGVLSRHLA